MRDAWLRKLQQSKTKRTKLGEGVPAPIEGNDGDFSLRKTPNGVKLYAKYSGQWYGFSPDGEVGDDNILSVDDSETVTTNGYIQLTGGFLIQWGKDTAPLDGLSAELDFPIAFPNKVCSLVGSKSISHPGAVDANDAGIQYVSNSKYKVYSDDVSRDVYWIALGN